jgi:hypothetical protein
MCFRLEPSALCIRCRSLLFIDECSTSQERQVSLGLDPAAISVVEFTSMIMSANYSSTLYQIITEQHDPDILSRKRTQWTHAQFATFDCLRS